MFKITIKHKGDFKFLNNYFEDLLKEKYVKILEKYGNEGVSRLAAATPKDSGRTARSWSYKIVHENGSVSLVFTNSNINKGVNIAIVLQYGHKIWNAGRNEIKNSRDNFINYTSGWYSGIDYINPALRPIFEKISDEAWLEVRQL